jgi:hypothetical protein
MVGWLCRTPRRLVLVVGAVLFVLVVGNYLMSRGDSSSSSDASATATPSVSFQAPDPAPFVRAAVHFTELWARMSPGRSVEQWRSELTPLATEDLARGLKLTDPSRLPDAKVSGVPVVRTLSENAALVVVPLSNDQRVLVTVVGSGDDLTVSAIQPDAGN